MSEIRVSSWCELQESLFEGSWDTSLRRFRSQYAFRGLSDSRYHLETTLMRLGGRFVERETGLLRNFRKYAHRDVVEQDSIWHWMSLAQHHGLPTRLLDWTFSPFVAMHFAAASMERFDIDGAIWAVHYGKAHRLVPEPLRALLDRERSDIFTVEMFSSILESLSDLARLSVKPFCLFFEPPSIDERIANQFALFSLMSDPESLLDEWIQSHPELWHKIIIPAELKWEIRDKLDQANVTERVLFPGMDGLSRWLKRYYSPRG